MRLNNPILEKTTFILIHGPWYGSWCYKELAKLLKEDGQTVLTPDLPGRQNTQFNKEFKNITLNTYVDYICDLALKQETKVTLVGHSMAGAIISQVAERIPDKVAHLIYVNAYIPENGKSPLDAINTMEEAGISSEIKTDLANNTLILNHSDKAIDCLLGSCEDNDIEKTQPLLQYVEACKPFSEPVKISSERFGKVKKTYIVGAQDDAIPYNEQFNTALKHNCRMIILQCGHAPFISEKELLADAILDSYGKKPLFGDKVVRPSNQEIFMKDLRRLVAKNERMEFNNKDKFH